MSNSLDSLSSVLCISIGAAPGAILRMKMSEKIFVNTKSTLAGIFTVNTIATFFLGLFLGLEEKIILFTNNQPLFLVLCVGFLGSFSTFSSLILELFKCFKEKKMMDFLGLICIALTLGLIAGSIGFFFGNA